MKKVILSTVVLLLVLIVVCDKLLFVDKISKGTCLEICREPDSSFFIKGKLHSLQKYSDNSKLPFERDLRSYDPSALDLKNNLPELLHSDFDSKTNWPRSLPAGFIPDSIMELGKNPGLNLRRLHEAGVTGRGVSIAIIDQELLVKHTEYKDQLKMYEEIHVQRNGTASMHGPAVASIAVGKTVGVAPCAELYYIASSLKTIRKIIFKNSEVNPKWYVKAIFRILEINKSLPTDKKIRVISISFGSYDNNFLKAIKVAEKEGVFVVSSSLSITHKFRFNGLGRDGYSDPDNPESYIPGSFWAENYYMNSGSLKKDSTLMIPMDSRCTASQSGNSSYAYFSNGGWSWCSPYIAGLYALACQVKPSINPKEFWEDALRTGDEISLLKDGNTYKFGKIVNPVRLIEYLLHSN